MGVVDENGYHLILAFENQFYTTSSEKNGNKTLYIDNDSQ